MIDLIIAGIIATSHHGGHHARSTSYEGCQWDQAENRWEYDDDTPCRGTGEDPTVDSQGLPACADHRLAVPQDNGRVTCVLPSSVRSSHDDWDCDQDGCDSEEVHSHGGHHSGSHHSHRRV